MLAIMRKALKGWAGKSLLILFVSPFLFFGAHSLFTAFNSAPGAVKVNGEAITDAQISNQVESNKERIRQRFGDKFDMSMLSDDALKEGAIGQLVEKELNKEYANKNHLEASFSTISEVIRNIPAFADESGKFSQDTFETVAARKGMTTRQITELIGNDIRDAQPEQAVRASTFGLPNEIKLKDSLSNQTRDMSYLLLKLDDFRGKIDVSDEDIKNYYNDNLDNYMTKEQLKVSYIELKASNYEKDVKVTEDEVLAKYKSDEQMIEQNAKRKASHILIAVNDKRTEKEAYKLAEEVEKKLSEGQSFSELAKKYSDDTGSAKNGGDLGFAGRGAYVPEFEKTLFSMKVGEVSDPVLTEFGYHIIKLVEIDKSQDIDYAKDKDRLKKTLIAEKARDIYQEKISAIEDVLYESTDLQNAGAEAGVEVKESDFFTRDDGTGIAAAKEVRDLAFSKDVLVDKENSSVVEIGDGHAVALRVKEHELPKAKPLDSVKNDILIAIKTEKARQNLMETKEKILEALKSGDSRESASKELKEDWVTKKNIKRQDADVPKEILSQLFKIPRPIADDKSSFSSTTVGDDVAIIDLLKVHDNKSELDDKRLSLLVRQASYQNASVVWGYHMNHLKANAKIVYHNKKSK